MYDGPGHYKHYKGNAYEVLGLALWEAMVEKGDNSNSTLVEQITEFAEGFAATDWGSVTMEEQERYRRMLLQAVALLQERAFVIYRPLDEGSMLEDREEDFWARGLRDFNQKVLTDLKLLSVGLTADGPQSHLQGEAQPRFKKLKPVTCLYFGATAPSSGHRFVWGRVTHRRDLTTEYSQVVQQLPWKTGVDGGLTPPGGEQSQAALYHKDGWTCIAWVNRLYDSRPGSNSAFFFDATLTFDQCIEVAREHFPRIIARHESSGFPIRLWTEAVTRVDA
jgi:hypothetical protein